MQQTDSTDQQRLTVAEIALVRELVKWRRANGVERIHWGADICRGPDGRVVSWDVDMWREVGVAASMRAPLRWVPVRSLREAVDVLVAFGFLPARFSSAYAAGWNHRYYEADQDYPAVPFEQKMMED